MVADRPEPFAPGTSSQVECLAAMGRRSSRRSAGQGGSSLDMLENLCNQRGLIDAGDYPEFSAALRAGFDVNTVN
jgi:hypothetical protein